MTIPGLASRVVVGLLFSGLAFAQTSEGPTILVTPQAQSGEGPLNPAPPRGITTDQIIEKFAAKEKEFNHARAGYTWRQTVKVQTLEGGGVDGEYQLITDELFDDKGKRVQRVVYAPQSTLQRIAISPNDVKDFEKGYPFVLTTDELPLYNITYAGQQRVDELDTYVFDVAPKKIEKDKRYFEGRIWVDNRDLQIVKTKGKNVPDIRGKQEDLFPPFETYREQVDGRYWFPTYTRAEGTLAFKSGDVEIRQIIKYQNYKRYGADVKITYEGQEIEKNKPNRDK
ncbi:MAG: hypothetical protein L0Z53_18260 [Acidobacteriales bacterium]|nr:hypothetical protein [Terriglobales bacterium]